MKIALSARTPALDVLPLCKCQTPDYVWCMRPPLKNFPLPLRLFTMLGMFMFNMGTVYYLSTLCIHGLFGVEQPENVMQGIFKGENDVYAFLFIQGLSSLGGFALTAVMYAVLENGKISEPLRLHVSPKIKMIFLALFSVVIAQFFIDFLVNINEKIPLPQSLTFLTDMQKKTEELTESLFEGTSAVQFIWLTVTIAFIPALSEELFFRGILLNTLMKSKINLYISLFISGFVFALAHGEFTNLIAITILGAFLGYVYYASGSLWLSIIAHFTNNFFAIVLKYLFNTGVLSSDLSKTETPLWATLLSLALFSVCLFIFHRWKKQNDASLVMNEIDSPQQNTLA